MVGLTVSDGQASGLLRSCDPFVMDGGSLYGDASSPLKSWDFDPSTSEDVDLGTVSSLLELASHNEDLGLGSNVELGGDPGGLRFTAEQLTSLQDDEVLFDDGQFLSNVQVISNQAFDRRVRALCGA